MQIASKRLRNKQIKLLGPSESKAPNFSVIEIAPSTQH